MSTLQTTSSGVVAAPRIGLLQRMFLGGLPLLAIGAAGSWMLLVVAGVFVIPKFFEIFADFGVALPAVTVMFLSLGRWLGGENPGQVVPGVVLMVPVIAMMWGLVPLSVIRSTRVAAMVIAFVLLLTAGLMLLVGMLALFLPLTGMIESLQKGP
jgi:hypothetical protein